MSYKELLTIEDKVYVILEKYKKARNDDRFLIGVYFNKHHGIRTFRQYYDNKNVPSIETLVRCRRKIQERGEFQSTNVIKQKRQKMETSFSAYSEVS